MTHVRRKCHLACLGRQDGHTAKLRGFEEDFLVGRNSLGELKTLLPEGRGVLGEAGGEGNFALLARRIGRTYRGHLSAYGSDVALCCRTPTVDGASSIVYDSTTAAAKNQRNALLTGHVRNRRILCGLVGNVLEG